MLCPAPPLLARDLTGRDPLLPELRDACASAVSWLVSGAPELVVVTGAAAVSVAWDPESRLDLSLYAPALGPAGQPGLPLSLGLGALLLDQAGYTGPRILHSVADGEVPGTCVALGERLAAAAPRAVLLAVGDGSARRSATAPGYLDERAIPFDTGIEQAVRDGDLAALAATDPGLARDLMATGRPAWQVLAGALGAQGPGRPATDVLYADGPFGVGYLVATFEPARS